ncbi:DUF7281 domain-containing protein [Methylomonas rivi]|uniref:DUF7281 domain-containing protein n=1 Tax=Methylomonas rivi TaxID=2952226 RepID=A0ABT1U748_9GAMM|nr:hypothetical protein [Methylomonas sp. WSC-6]MCQ8129684.1 hypothetical protein [Methylomonas sp. WSC-6]
MSRYSCGYVSNNCLIFSADDKRHLRQQIKAELDLDPFTTEQLPADRLEMAQYHANEKLAGKPASHDQLLLNSVDGMLRINNVEIPLHPQSIASAGLLCLSSGIETIQHQTIVVVENLAIMPLCHSWQIPCIDPQALWVYRGDYKSGAKARVCRDFVDRFGSDRTVIVFSDMDPKGLEIAITMPYVNYWLGPEQAVWHACLKSKLANCEGFDLQNSALTYLERLSNEQKLSELLNVLIMCMKKERSSFRQEHMLSRKVELALFAVAARLRDKRAGNRSLTEFTD